MARSLRIAAVLGLVASLVLGTGRGRGRARVITRSSTRGSSDSPSPGLVLAGVTGAGHAWAIADGNAKLFEDGRVKLDVEGLVLTPEGTNPVANGRVVVSCNGGATPATSSSPISCRCRVPDGNAAFHRDAAAAEPVPRPGRLLREPRGRLVRRSGLTARRPFHSRRE